MIYRVSKGPLYLVLFFLVSSHEKLFVCIHVSALVTYRQSVVGLDLFSLIREPNLCNVKAYRFHCYEQSAALFTGSLVNI